MTLSSGIVIPKLFCWNTFYFIKNCFPFFRFILQFKYYIRCLKVYMPINHINFEHHFRIAKIKYLLWKRAWVWEGWENHWSHPPSLCSETEAQRDAVICLRSPSKLLTKSELELPGHWVLLPARGPASKWWLHKRRGRTIKFTLQNELVTIRPKGWRLGRSLPVPVSQHKRQDALEKIFFVFLGGFWFVCFHLKSPRCWSWCWDYTNWAVTSSALLSKRHTAKAVICKACV